jgi:hypothetical protein
MARAGIAARCQAIEDATGRLRGGRSMIQVVCGCGRVFKAEERHSGKRTRCPVCGASLIIGRTPAPDSGGGDLEELPSWWYPSMTEDSPGVGAAPSPANPHAEAVRTQVFETGLLTEREDSPGLQDDGPGTRVVGVGTGRPFWIMAGIAAVLAVLVLGALWWRRGPAPGRGDAMAGQAPPAGAVRREAARIPGPEKATNRGVLQANDDGRPARSSRRLRLLVPAYIYPTPEGRKEWHRLMDAAARLDVVAVVNPDSGPGAEPNPDYSALIAEAARHGVKVVGYVSTGFGDRPAEKVKADIDAWVRFYHPIGGFFLDQQPRDARHAAYLADISSYARGKFRDALIITNPGSPCDESYLARRASDVVCVFCSSESFALSEMPNDLRGYDPSHFAALAYQVKDAEAMRELLRQAIVKRVGYIYATDGKWPNPWDHLPAYWEAEVDAVIRLH